MSIKSIIILSKISEKKKLKKFYKNGKKIKMNEQKGKRNPQEKLRLCYEYIFVYALNPFSQTFMLLEKILRKFFNVLLIYITNMREFHSKHSPYQFCCYF